MQSYTMLVFDKHVTNCNFLHYIHPPPPPPSEGVCEIWLTSEDTGAYGRDIGTDLPTLLWRLVQEIPEGAMLRLGMTNPPYILEHLEVPSHHRLTFQPKCHHQIQTNARTKALPPLCSPPAAPSLSAGQIILLGLNSIS